MDDDDLQDVTEEQKRVINEHFDNVIAYIHNAIDHVDGSLRAALSEEGMFYTVACCLLLDMEGKVSMDHNKYVDFVHDIMKNKYKIHNYKSEDGEHQEFWLEKTTE